MSKEKSPFEKDIKAILAKIKAGKSSKEDKAKLEELRSKERDYLQKGEKPSFHAGNDFSWWNKVPELMKDASNLKSNWIAGTALADADLPFIPAGILKVDYAPCYGIGQAATDPINVWARDLYLRMFQKWRGISAYSQSDLGITIIAGCEIVRMIAKLERIYGVINRYSKVNINMPFAEVGALGLTITEADYIRNNLSDYRYDLNELLRKAQRLCIPKDMSVIANSISLLGYEYMDHDNIKGQIILFDSDLFGVYEDAFLSTGGSVRFGTPKTTGVFGISRPLIDFTASQNGTNMFPALNYMLEQLLGSTSVAKIYGDLITWFGEEQMLQFVPLGEDYIVAPVYSESILHKLHNLESFGGAFYLASVANASMPAADVTALFKEYAIYQYNDSICSLISAVSAGVASPAQKTINGFTYTCANFDQASGGYRVVSPAILDTYRVDPDEEVIVEGVLWKFNAKTINDGGSPKYYAAPIQTAAFEIIMNVKLYRVDPTSVNQFTFTMPYTISPSISTAQAAAGQLAVIDWAPLTYHQDSGVGSINAVYGDLDTPIPVYLNTMSKLHRAIVFSGLHTDVRVLASSK